MAGEVSPQPLFEVERFELEHKPSIKRIEKAQTAALDVANDPELPCDVKLLHLMRMRAYLDTLIDQLQD